MGSEPPSHLVVHDLSSPMASAPDRRALLLLFTAGGLLYALDTRHVIEVIPRVALRPMRNQPAHAPGMFNYRGAVAPVVDLCQLIEGSPSSETLSSRVIMVHHPSEPDVPVGCLGLLAEGVTDTLSLPLDAFQVSGLADASRPYLAGMTLDERGMVQLLRLELLLPLLRSLEPADDDGIG
jgi:chemotaxis-related protein WspB